MGRIKEALAFPFKRFGRMFYYWWVLIPVLGWLVYYGYAIDFIRAVLAGEEELPAFNEFWRLFKTGFFLAVIILIISLAAVVLRVIPFVGWILYLYAILIMPILIVQFAASERFVDGLDFVRATKIIVNNLLDYVILILQIIVVTVVWLVASIPVITLIITLPATSFGVLYLITKFYKKALAKT